MVTNYPHPIATQERLRTGIGSAPEGRLARAMGTIKQTLCGLGGHDTLLHFEDDRMSLRCVSCGHETPGWELNQARPAITVRGDARRHALARPQLVDERRIA